MHINYPKMRLRNVRTNVPYSSKRLQKWQLKQSKNSNSYRRLLWRGLDPVGTLRISDPNSLFIGAWFLWFMGWNSSSSWSWFPVGGWPWNRRPETLVGAVVRRRLVVERIKMRWKRVDMIMGYCGAILSSWAS